MILRLRPACETEQIEELERFLHSQEARFQRLPENEGIQIRDSDYERLAPELRERTEILNVLDSRDDYLRAERIFHPENSVFELGGRLIGGNAIQVIAGPCAVESQAQIGRIAGCVAASGAGLIRGGTYKPRTSPYSFQGLGREGLNYLAEAGRAVNCPVVSEITSTDQLEDFVGAVDLIQVGARSMQNFDLLRALGCIDKPVLLKRGFGNTLEELLRSAEHIMAGGNQRVILCERGIRTFERAMRCTLDLSAVPYLKQKSHLPVFVDPSHASGDRRYVEAMASAAIAAGADGLEIEVHDQPGAALSDGAQALLPEEFERLMRRLGAIAEAIGRQIG